MEISFAEADEPRSGAVVVGVWEEAVLTPAARRLDEATDGAIRRALSAAQRFKGKKDELLPIVGPPGLTVNRIILAGLGKPAAMNARFLQQLGGNLVAHLNGAGETEATFAIDVDEADIDPADAAAHLAFGARLKSYRFDKYKTKQKPEQKASLRRIVVTTAAPSVAERAYQPLDKTADAVFFTRDLVSEPANVIYPESLAAQAEALADLGLVVEVLDEQKLRKLGMNALLGVAQGSARPPRVVVMEWRGAGGDDGPRQPLAFVGKGVTFDTGGISIKPAANMEDMKGDMGGAAAVTGLMHTLASRGAKVNVVGVIGLVENMPDGNAQRPGDIVTSMSGQTIEVINTDAEGRLVLADVLHYVNTRFKPRFMVDLATLTGAIIIALGHEYAGLFSNDDRLADRLLKAGRQTGEKLWRMPVGPEFDKQIESKFADMKNVGGRPGGSSTAALILSRFVDKTPWAHLDIAGTGMGSPQNEINKSWGSGFGVRLLDKLVADHYEN